MNHNYKHMRSSQHQIARNHAGSYSQSSYGETSQTFTPGEESNAEKAAKFAVVSAVAGIIGNVAHGIFVSIFEI